ncbi:MAG: sugar phosphorylase [Anaerolineales bacterium]|nr:sugar phosphorylase [Anaerolineales bacterium]
MNKHEKILFEHIAFIYGKDEADSIFDRIIKRLDHFRKHNPDLVHSHPTDRVSEADSILITYGDMVRTGGERPLKTLASFLQKYIGDVISTVHILPFYPYSSDDGFSIIDYYQVNPDFGDWEDIEYLGKNFRLMFDAVVNHVSSQSVWFQGFLKDDPAYREFFTVVDPGTDLSRVFRPRAAPVLTPFLTPSGEKLVWTTFSADQIDLNFANPDVLLEVIDILLFFAAHGADFIRLDAVTFVWKEIGTTCVNSPHTHRIVQTIRTVFDLAAPKVAIITETNVPHKDNIAYFGDGTNEAQLVYNFALPLLTINAFNQQNTSPLSAWASTLNLPSDQTTFFNFLACHDGIGILPVKDILIASDIEDVVERTNQQGGFISYKSNEDGSQSPYELNINYLDILGDPQKPAGDIETTAQRFLATQAIMLVLRGVPGIYFHSLFGSRNWAKGVEQTGRYRTINREKFLVDQLEKELADPQSLRHHVFHGYHHLLIIRKSNPAFHPSSGQEILSVDKSIFALIRTSIDQDSHTLCLTNVTPENVNIKLDLDTLPLSNALTLVDILTGDLIPVTQGQLRLTFTPYQVLWLQKQ